jgi:ankyrin repeat protein
MNTNKQIAKPLFQLTLTMAFCMAITLSGCNRPKAVTNKNTTEPAIITDVATESSDPADDKTPTKGSSTPQASIPLQTFLDSALNGETKTIQLAVDSEFDVNSLDEQKRCALMLAAFNGHTDIVKLLVRNGASLNLRDTSGRSALMFASTGANSDTVEFLIVSGAELNAVDNSEGFTALMFAAAEGQTEVVQTLLRYKANASIKDADGESALGFATKNGHVETAKLLAE